MIRLLRAAVLAALVVLPTAGCIPLLVGGLVGYEIAKDRQEDKSLAAAPRRSVCDRSADGKLVCEEAVVTTQPPAPNH